MPVSSFSVLGFDGDDRRRFSFGAIYQRRIGSKAKLRALCALIGLATTLSAESGVIQYESDLRHSRNTRVLADFVEALERSDSDASADIADSGSAHHQARVLFLKKRYEQLLAALNSNGNIKLLQGVSLPSTVARLRQKLSSAIRYERSLVKVLKDKHPDLIEARAEISAVRAQILSRLRPLVRSAKAEWQAAEAAAIADSPGRPIEAASRHQEPSTIPEPSDRAEDILPKPKQRQPMVDALHEVDRPPAQRSDPSPKESLASVSISQPAPPTRPFLILALGLLAGLCAGILSARIFDKLGRRLSSSAQLAFVSGLSVMPAIPKHDVIGLPQAWYRATSSKISAGPYSDLLATLSGKFDDDGADYRQAIKRLLARIKIQRRPGRPQCVMFVSPREGVGNSAVTLSLAYAAALDGARVLVVDATVTTPDIARAFSASLNCSGLVALDNKDQLNQSIFCDASTGIAILPIALMELDALTYPQRRRLVAGLNKVSQSYDMICVDAGGMIEDQSANFLLDFADHILLVARAHATTVEDVRQTMALIEPARSRITGAVLTYSAEGVR